MNYIFFYKKHQTQIIQSFGMPLHMCGEDLECHLINYQSLQLIAVAPY